MPRCISISADGRRVLLKPGVDHSELWKLPMNPGTRSPAGEASPLILNTTLRNSRPLYRPTEPILYFARLAGDVGVAYVAGADARAASASRCAPRRIFPPPGRAIASTLAYVFEAGWPASVCSDSAVGQGELPADRDPSDGGDDPCRPMGGRWPTTWREGWTTASYVLDVGSGASRQISPEGVSVAFPCWSLDSKWIATEVEHGDGTEVLVIPAGGGEAKRLGWGVSPCLAHSWAPDGDKLALAGCATGMEPVVGLTGSGE